MRTILVASLLILLAAVACATEVPEPVATTEPTTTVASSLPTNTPFSPTATPESVTMTLDCEDERFIEEIVKLSEDRESPFQARILKLYKGSEELERTEGVLRCKAEARLSNLTDSYIIYHVEIDRDGDQFIGYRIGDPIASPTPEPTAVPTEVGFGPGMYLVGERLQPGIYAGKTGIDLLDSCYWARLSGASGEFSDLIANDNAVGQFYVEVLATDKFFEIDCDITPLHAWPMPDEPLSKIEPGIYLVGRDISPGTYRGEAGTDVLDSCYWARLSGVSGEFSDLIANDNAVGQYFVSIQDSDYAFATGCALESAEESS